MDAGVVSQLRVEACSKDVPLADRDNVPRLVIGVNGRALAGQSGSPSGQSCQNLHTICHGLTSDLVFRLARRRNDGFFTLSLGHLFALLVREDFLHDGGADEDGGEGGLISAQEGQVERGLETLCLSAEMVAIDTHVQPTDQILTTFLCAVGRLSEEDQTGAGTPSRPPVDPGCQLV